jgi:hypothetical protein
MSSDLPYRFIKITLKKCVTKNKFLNLYGWYWNQLNVCMGADSLTINRQRVPSDRWFHFTCSQCRHPENCNFKGLYLRSQSSTFYKLNIFFHKPYFTTIPKIHNISHLLSKAVTAVSNDVGIPYISCSELSYLNFHRNVYGMISVSIFFQFMKILVGLE